MRWGQQPTACLLLLLLVLPNNYTGTTAGGFNEDYDQGGDLSVFLPHTEIQLRANDSARLSFVSRQCQIAFRGIQYLNEKKC